MSVFAQMPRFSLSSHKRLLLLSAVSSLVIFTLLRVLSCEVGIVAYLQNYVYACALFGLGIGCLDARLGRIKARESSWFVVFTVILALLSAIHFTVSQDLGALKDGSTYFVYPRFPGNYLLHEMLVTGLLFAVFTLVVRCFVPLGSAMGALFADMTADSGLALFWAGAIIGLGVYFCSLWSMCPPVVLVGLLGAAFLYLSGRGSFNFALIIVSIGCALSYDVTVEPRGAAVFPQSSQSAYRAYFKSFWAPEGHIVTRPLVAGDDVVGFVVSNNHIPNQMVIDTRLSDEQCAAVGTMEDRLKGYTSKYFKTPFLVAGSPEHVLILGGGSGNEAAEALRMGAGEVDVVDSRPWLFQLGEQHPLQPFKSPQVHRIVMNPRQFLKEPVKKYDLIVFGALESDSAFSPFGLLRPDNFTYTTESFLDARDHLNPRGYTGLSFRPFRLWYVLRLIRNLKEGYGTLDAIVRLPFRSYMFASREQNRILSTLLLESFKSDQLENVEKVMDEAAEIPPTFDDWPFLYLAAPGLPRTYLFCLVLMIAAMFSQLRGLVRSDAAADTGQESREQPSVFGWRSLRMIILGAAFMTAAGKTVMTLGFNYGTSWQNAIIAPVLVMGCALLAAVFGSRNLRLPAWLVWLCVFLAYAGDYSFNYEAVVSIGNPVLKFLAAGALPLLPPFFVAMALEHSIHDATDQNVALGMLFIGMVAGMIVEHLCLITTISSLDVPGVILCAAAILVRPKTATVPEASPAT